MHTMMRRHVLVTVYPEVAETFRTAAGAARPRETGGILVGWWAAGQPMVRYAVEVPDPNASGTTWSRSKASAQQALDTALAKLAHPWLGYVGDWHTHPAPNSVSDQDERSITHASHAYAHPLVLLVRADGRLDVRVARQGQRRCAVLRYLVEAGEHI